MLNSSKRIINDYCYYLNNRIGDGCSSQVYRGINEKTRQQVAIKIVSKIQHSKEQNVKMAETEIRFLQQLNLSPNILQLVHATRTKNNIYIMTELCSHGTLYDVLKQKGRLSEQRALFYLCQIINGYRSIGQKNIVHRDIKPVNIFVTEKDQIKIGDFGFAKQLGKGEETVEGNAGSPYYMAPEVIAENTHSCRSDIWAIGITFLEMLMGSVPWKARNQKQLVKQISDLQISKILPSGISKKSREFLQRSLVVDFKGRMNLQELLSFNFNNIALQNNQSQQLIESSSKANLKKSLSQHCINAGVKGTNTQKCFLKADYQRKKSYSFVQDLSIQVNKFNQKQKLNAYTNLECPKNVSDQSTSNDQKTDGKLFKKKHELNMKQKLKISIDRQLIENAKHQKNIETPKGFNFTSIKQNGKIKQKKKIRFMEVQDFHFESNQTKPQQIVSKNAIKITGVISKQSEKVQKQRKQSIIHSMDQKNTQQYKQILVQIEGQVNYFRFVFKLFKKIKQTLKTNDLNIQAFQQHLLHLAFSIIFQTQNLKYLKGVSLNQLKEFKGSSHYQNFMSVIKQYEQRYIQEQKKNKMKLQFRGQTFFLALLAHVMKIVFENIVMVEQRENELNSKKSLVFILQDMIKLSKFYLLSRQQNWQAFSNRSHLSRILQQVVPKSINKSYWQQVKMKFTKLSQL